MAQCFTEAKPLTPSPMHLYASTFNKPMYSSDGNIDPVKGYDPQRSSKEGSLIKGYGSFGMPACLKSNKEVYAGQGSCMKPSLKEQQQLSLNCTVPCLSDSNTGLNHANSVGNPVNRSPLSHCSLQGQVTSASNGDGAEKRSLVCKATVGASADRSSLGKMVVGSSSKAGEIPRPNQSVKGAVICTAAVVESTAGRMPSSLDGSARPAISSASSKMGNELASAHGGGLPVSISADETTPPTAVKHELLSRRAPAQSWPNSPANLRSIPRTRNLSEGSFNLIFPVGDLEKTSSGTRSTVSSPCRSWSTAETPVTRSSSDGCVLSTMYSPVNYQGSLSRTKSDPETSSQLALTESSNPTGHVQFALTGKNIDRFSLGHQSPCNSGTNMKPMGSNSVLSHASSHSSQDVACATIKSTTSECQNRIASDASSKRVMPLSNYSNGKTLYNDGITAGNLSQAVSVGSILNSSKGMLESTSFGNVTNGSQHGSMPVTVPSTFGNIIKENPNMDVKKTNPRKDGHTINESLLLRKALSSTDPEEVKNIGNDHYKKGRFADALLLYERAIFLLPRQALYHSNLAAALAAVGRIGDAIHECREAIKLDPSYARAQQRLASFLLRLGRAEDAKEHFRAAGNLSDLRDIQRCDIIFKYLGRCLEMRMARDWASVVRESDAAIVAGAESSSKVFAFKAEALLHLGKLDEAVSVMFAAQKVESSLKKSTGLAESCVQIVQAEINLALGKFQEAIGAAEWAVKIDPKNLDASWVLQKALAICRSRTSGNELYKAGKYFEACAAYGEGLEHDPMNAVLLCNRAACRSMLGRYESAIEDCTAALTAQPNYVKARLRRANCYTKLEQWEEALRDYEMLRKELPGDFEVAKALLHVQASRKKSQGEESFQKRFSSGLHRISTANQFREAVSSPGLVVVYLYSEDRAGPGQVDAHVMKLCEKYPTINFIKVNVEENWPLVKSEKVPGAPSFQLYKNGLNVEEIEALSYRSLEQAIQLLIH